MGLFSSKKKIKVSSSLYNLAGAVENRPIFLKDTIVSHVVSGSKASMGDALVGSLLRGPGIKFRSFARWAKTSGYTDSIQWDPGSISVGSSIDLDVLATVIPHTPQEQVAIQTAEIGIADYGFWADQWMLANHPNEVDADYDIDFNEETWVITLTFAGGVKSYSFSPVGFDPMARYLYSSYMLIIKDQGGPWSEGADIIVDSPADWPNTSNWELTNVINTPRSFNCVDTVLTEVSYSDGRPNESNTTTNPHIEAYTDVSNVYERGVFQGANSSGTGTSTIFYRTTKNTFGAITSNVSTTTSTEVLPGGVTKTTKVTTTTQSVGNRYSYSEDLRIVMNDQWSRMHVLIYKENSGNPTLDAMFSPKTNAGQFMPFIPLRYFNTMVNEANYPEQTAWNKKAIKKAMNKDYQYLVGQLEDNPSLGDIDFAYVVFGVPLNTPDRSGRRYIFRFFQMLLNDTGSGTAAYNQWRTNWAAADATQQHWLAWKEAQSIPTSPLWGTPEPLRATYPTPPRRVVRSYGRKWNYDMLVSWTSITEAVGMGQGKPGAMSGDVWFDTSSAIQFNELLVSGGMSGDRTFESNTVFMYWQETANIYRALAVTGLWHNYIIYGGKGVDIYGDGAMRDPEESGFLIPIHDGIFKEISLVDATQMSTACSFMLLNSYQVVKKKWYSSSWFKIVLIVAAIVITVVTMGSGSGVGAGLASIAAATTTAAAISATVSLLVSLAANALIATLLMRILTPVATSLFGEEFGAVIAAVGTMVIMAAGTSLMNGGTAADGLTKLSTAPELMKMTVSALDNYNRVQTTELLDIQKEIKKLQETYSSEMERIQAAWKQNLGDGSGTIDPMVVSEAISLQYENADTFLQRTLLLGSDIVEMTNGFISAFPELTINNELNV